MRESEIQESEVSILGCLVGHCQASTARKSLEVASKAELASRGGGLLHHDESRAACSTSATAHRLRTKASAASTTAAVRGAWPPRVLLTTGKPLGKEVEDLGK